MANGIIIIDKPAGWTSMDVCAKLRGIFHVKRVGHAGTLDPMATGVLPVFVGRATRAVEFADQAGKEYVAGLRLGLVTDTQDTGGRVLEEREAAVSRSELEAALEPFRGDILQVPPMYSAIKVNGKKLYELARKGKEVERKARPVTIYELELLGGADGAQDTLVEDLATPQSAPLARTAPLEGEPRGECSCSEFSLRVKCSKGTYVRTLCHDIGRALGCGGCMSALRRTECAGFTLADAVTLEAVQAAADRGEAERLLLPVDAYFREYPAITVGEREEKAARNGAAFRWTGADGTYRVYAPGGAFLLLGALERGQVRTVKSFFEIEERR